MGDLRMSPMKPIIRKILIYVTHFFKTSFFVMTGLILFIFPFVYFPTSLKFGMGLWKHINFHFTKGISKLCSIWQRCRNCEGSEGSCPHLWNRRGPPPSLSLVNLLPFHHIYNFYKDVLCRRQHATAKHIVSLSWTDWFLDKLDYFSLIRFISFNLVTAQWYQVK